MKKIVGKHIVTTEENMELIGDNKKNTIDFVTNFVFQNMGEEDVHIIINEGDEILVLPNETVKLGDIKVFSLVVVEKNSEVRYMGIRG